MVDMAYLAVNITTTMTQELPNWLQQQVDTCYLRCNILPTTSMALKSSTGIQDSIFLNNTSERQLKEFQERFKQEYDIELEIKNRYDKLLLTKKKHYVGYENGELDIVGMEGKKSNTPEFFKRIYKRLIENIIERNKDPLPEVREAFLTINAADPNLLKESQVLNQELEEYDITGQLYNAAKAQGANKGDLVEFYKANEKETGNTWTLDPSKIDIWKYKELLWNKVYGTLDAAGHSITELAQELGIKLEKDGSAKKRCGVDSGKRQKKNKKACLLESYSIIRNEMDDAGGGKKK